LWKLRNDEVDEVIDDEIDDTYSRKLSTRMMADEVDD
jgi:hypothetical protein